MANVDVDKSINDTNLMSQGYGEIKDYYNDIKDKLVYKEITQDYSKNPKLVDIGCVCNSEYSSFYFNSERYWDSDNVDVNLQNAQKLANDLEWTEQSYMRSGKIKAYQGMVVLTKTAANYIQDDVTYFNDVAKNVNNPSKDFNTFSVASGGTGTAIDLFGYFAPDSTGTWKFSIPSSNPSVNLFTYLWVGDTALYDYKASNANIKSNTPTQSGGQNEASFVMNKGDFIPFRVQFISKNASYSSTNGTPFTITPPSSSNSKSIITSNPANGWSYFITFMKDNAIYYKNLLYFGLVQSIKDKNKYDCHFINSNTININNFQTYKQNPQLQYFRSEIPTPTMTGKGSINITEGDAVKLDFQSGVKIVINNATYGVPGGDYTYKVYKEGTITTTRTIPTETKTTQVNTTDSYIPTEYRTNTIFEHKKTTSVPGMVFDKEARSKRMKDVTADVQKLVNSAGGSKLIINSGSNNFKSLFGDPIEYDKDPAKDPSVKKFLTVEYTYTVDESIITEKNIFLDSATAIITAGASFSGNKVTTVMPMDTIPSCSSGNCNKYKMTLSNDGRLVVYDSNNSEIGNIRLIKYIEKNNPDFKIINCQVNNSWLSDPYMASSLNAGSNTVFTNGNKLKSPDGRFKLEFENNKLIFTYCYLPYYSLSNGLKYTTIYNINNTNNAQIYYLYRINTRGLIGRKFLNETDSSTGITTLHYIPNSHTNVLYQTQNPDKFVKPFGSATYPIMKDGKLAFASNYNSNITSAKTYKDCANQCLTEPNNGCEHFFFLTKNDGTTQCYTDKVSDANPLFTTTKTNSNFKNSDLYRKPYNIKTTCGITPDFQELYRPNESSISNVTIDYRIPENAPNLTYYCSLDQYKEDNNMTIRTYNLGNKESFTTLKEGMDAPNTASATSESQYGPYAPYVVSHTTKKFPILNRLTQEYSKTQDKVSEQYDQTINYLREYENSLMNIQGPEYKFSGTDSLIPDKYKNDTNPKPNISFIDGAKKDVGIMLMQQNTMYTLGSITAATCLILAVAFGGNTE